jgi:hypothetical protein
MSLEFVDELPPRPGKYATVMIPIIEELKVNPGRWAKIHKYPNAGTGYVAAARWNSKYNTHGCLFRSRKEDDGGVQVYGIFDISQVRDAD